MPRRELPPRLYLDPKRQTWTIRYRKLFKRLPYGPDDRKKAEAALARALANKSATRGIRGIRRPRSTTIWPRAATVGMVYFISKSGCSEYPIKIGFSGDGSKPRIGSLQTGNPEPLSIIATCEAMFADEQALHRILAPARRHGEWFARTDDVRAALSSAQAGALKDWIEARG